MKSARIALVALSVLACAPAAAAATDASAEPQPVGSPGSWVGTDDYPISALHLHMAGTTGFKLTVDAGGKPVRCDIVRSSGFDVLDTAACERVMARARFTPARDAAGKPMEGIYRTSVRWVEPAGDPPPISESFASMMMTIDQTGKMTSCKMVSHVPVESEKPTQAPCPADQNALPPAMGLVLRGNFNGPLAEVQIDAAQIFTPALRARILAPIPGYEQQAMFIQNYTVTSDGKLGKCVFEEQRGDIRLAQDFCLGARVASFDPPFSAIGKDGVANGWYIMRVSLKSVK